MSDILFNSLLLHIVLIRVLLALSRIVATFLILVD